MSRSLGRPASPAMRVSLVLLLALVGCASSRPAERAPITVQSFNLRLNVESDGENAWPNRTEAAVAILREADLIGVQEALPGMLEDLDARAPAFARIGVGRQADGGGEYSAIYYRTARFELLEDGTFWLSATPEVPGSVGWDAALPRICTWGRFRDRTTGAVFVHANTHFDHVGEEARRESARLLVARLAEIAGEAPLILTGDFNVTPDTDPYRVLASAFRDARDATETAPEGMAPTWNDFGRADLTRRIDFVFVHGSVRVLQFETIDGTIGDVLGTDDPRYPSDHFPVEAWVTLQP